MAKNRIVLRCDYQKLQGMAPFIADEISINFDDFRYNIYYKAVKADGSKTIYLKDSQPDYKGDRALFHIKSFLKRGYYIIEKRLTDDILGI